MSMESKISRGEKLLEKLVNGRKITPSGADWLITALDPFHDTQLKNLQGWPDVETGPSVVRCVKQSYTLAAPSSIPSGTNWDCHVIMWPWHESIPFLPSNSRNNNQVDFLNLTVGQGSVGGIQAYAVPAGTNLLPVVPGVAIATSTLGLNYTQGSGRLTGIGFEVTNTTAEIYKQGTAFVWKHMQAAESPASWTFHEAATGNAMVNSVAPYRHPPRNAAEAMLIPGTRQWAASEGCYMVGSFHSVENPPVAAGYVQPVIMLPLSEDQESPNVNTDHIYMPSVNPITFAATDDLQYYVPSLKLDPIHQSGALFAGLSYQTNLTLTTIYYYETFPGLPNQDILVLATPSAEYDAEVLNIYSHTIGVSPIGVKVGENGLGDWFMGVIQKASSFISPILRSIPNPLAQAAGVGLGYVGESMGQYMTPANAVVPKGRPVTKKVVSKPAPPNGGKGTKIAVIPTNIKALKELARLSNGTLQKRGFTARQIKIIRADALG